VTSADLLADAFDRIRGVVGRALDGLTDEQLTEQVGPDANPISWLVWHLTRIQDDHVCDVAGIEQAWIGQGWYERFGLPFPVTDHGYGHTEQQVEQARVPGIHRRGSTRIRRTRPASGGRTTPSPTCALTYRRAARCSASTSAPRPLAWRSPT